VRTFCVCDSIACVLCLLVWRCVMMCLQVFSSMPGSQLHNLSMLSNDVCKNVIAEFCQMTCLHEGSCAYLCSFMLLFESSWAYPMISVSTLLYKSWKVMESYGVYNSNFIALESH